MAAEYRGEQMHLVRITDLRHCLIAAFETLELPPEDAEQLAEVLLDSELRGHESHGVHLLGFLAHTYRAGTMNPQPRIRVLRQTEGALLLDGDRSHALLFTAEESVEMMRRAGVQPTRHRGNKQDKSALETRRYAPPGLSFCSTSENFSPREAYSPKCLEGKFCEVRVLSWQP
jgi:Malate/L-lactate dehydrogenase